MPSITINLTDTQYAGLEYAALSPQEWAWLRPQQYDRQKPKQKPQQWQPEVSDVALCQGTRRHRHSGHRCRA
jgi:hypothetical protein